MVNKVIVVRPQQLHSKQTNKSVVAAHVPVTPAHGRQNQQARK